MGVGLASDQSVDAATAKALRVVEQISVTLAH
jgi:hypothetical protein